LPCLSGSDRIRNKCRSRAGNTDTLEESCQKDREVDHGESNQVQKAQENEARSGIPQTEVSQGFRPEENGETEARAQISGPQGVVGPQVSREAQAGRKGSQENDRREAGSEARSKAGRCREARCAASDAPSPSGAACDGAAGTAASDGATGTATAASASRDGTASTAGDAADRGPGGSYPAATGSYPAAAATVSDAVSIAIDSVTVVIALWRAFLRRRGQRRFRRRRTRRRTWRRTWQYVST